MLFYQHLGIVARPYPTPARTPPPAAADAAYEMRFVAATEPGFVWSDEKMTVKRNGRVEGEGKRREGRRGEGSRVSGVNNNETKLTARLCSPCASLHNYSYLYLFMPARWKFLVYLKGNKDE